MSAKPRFKPRVMMADKHGNTYQRGEDPSDKTRVIVADARDLTAEKAVEKVLQSLSNVGANHSWLAHAATKAGMSARVVNGKVRVRRAER